jgi:hypothetical protein
MFDLSLTSAFDLALAKAHPWPGESARNAIRPSGKAAVDEDDR